MLADQNGLPLNNALVTGGTGFLGSYFLASAAGSYQKLWSLVRGVNLTVAQKRLGQRVDGIRPGAMERVDVVLGDVEEEGAGLSGADLDKLSSEGVGDVWHFAATLAYESRKREMIFRRNIDGTKRVFELARRLGAKRFIYISTAFVAGRRTGLIPEALLDIVEGGFNNVYEESKCRTEHAVMQMGREFGLDVRILRPPIVVGPTTTFSSSGSDSGYYGFGNLLLQWREMFANGPRPTRLRVVLDTPVHLTPVDSFIADAQHLLDNGFPGGPIYNCVAPTEVLARHLPKIFTQSLGVREMDFAEVPVDKPTVVEKIVDRVMSLYGVAVREPKRFERSLPPRATVTPAMAERFLTVWREEHEAKAPQGYRRERVRSFDGTSLDTYVAGPSSGAKTIALVNAFGMDVTFLEPLITHLSQTFRVVTWDSRGLPDTSEPFPETCDVTAHAHDLGAVLDHYGADDATVVGWCTGAQVALRFAALAPKRARAIVSLHGAFSFPESVGMTAFKKNIMYLMPRIARGHEHAKAYHDMLYGATRGDTAAGADASKDEGRAAETMLSSDELLLNMTSAPFKTPETLYRYAKLVVHLVREPEHVWAPFVECPILVLSGERDSVAHPEESRELARRIKHATLHIGEGADHFALYNDPTYGKLIHDFAARARAS